MSSTTHDNRVIIYWAEAKEVRMSSPLKVAYILHRFPCLTETFITRELSCLQDEGVETSIFSLLPPKKEVIHAQAKALLSRAHYSPFMSWKILKAQGHFLRRSPRRYARVLRQTVAQTYREPRVLLIMLLLFGKCVFFAQQMEEEGVAHIHAHFVWLEGVAASIAATLLGVTYSINPHAFGLFSRNQGNVRRELEAASKITTISDYNRRAIAALCPSVNVQDIEIIRCGLDTQEVEPVTITKRQGPIRLLSIGRAEEKKGHRYLLEACALLMERGLDFRCDIAGGSGPSAALLQEQIERLNLGGRVRLLGQRDQDGIEDLYRNSDVFVLSCVVAKSGDRDGIPVVLMEAMARALPVVSTAVSGVPELVEGEAGLLVPSRDARGLADALERLIKDPTLRQRLGQGGRRRVLGEFQIQPNVAKLAAVFRRCHADNIVSKQLESSL